MNIEWNWKTILIGATILVLLVGTNLGQYYWIWKPKLEELTTSYESEIAHLEETIRRIGPMVTIWTVNSESEHIFPGKQIEESDLAAMQLPESLIQPSFILDPSSIIGMYYRIGITPGTPLSWDTIMADQLEDTSREFDIVANQLPIGLKIGDYIDFRIVYPGGEDYIVLSHKRVEAINGEVIKVRLDEREIHHYQASLVDYFVQKKYGSMIYMTKYIEPGVQKPADEYYAVPENIMNVMLIDPNIIEEINRQVNDELRQNIDESRSGASIDDAEQAIPQGRNEVGGKISQGTMEFKNRMRELQQAADEAQRAEALPPPSEVPLPADSVQDMAPEHVYETPGYGDPSIGQNDGMSYEYQPPYQDYTIPLEPEEGSQDYTIPEETPAFNIEEGVVE